MRDDLAQCVRQHGFSLSEEQIGLFCRFAALLLEKNRQMNLTAITEPHAVALHHFIDCLYLCRAAELAGASVIDVGCGAGFPSVPLLIAVPDLRMTLLDSTAKRVRWLHDEALPALGLDAECVTARAEEYAAMRREAFDFAVSRAVAPLNILAELCLPFVRPGGKLLAMKGPGAPDELRAAHNAIRQLGGEAVQTLPYTLGDAARQIVVIAKRAPTPARYPRRFSQIRQKPL